MAKIGTWQRGLTIEKRHYEWINKSNVSIKVFKHPDGDWNVSVLRPRSLYENLLGGSPYKQNQSKTNAFRIARNFMRDNP